MSLQTRITALAQAIGGDVKAIFTALSGKVDSTDTRLSNARAPTAHTHPIADIVTTVSEGIYLKNTPGGAVDLNTLTVPGNYSFGSAATNKPVAGGGTLLVGDIAGNVAQILVRLQNTSTPEVWYRTYGITSGWGSWLRIADSLVLASPPAIGSTTPASGKFTTLETTSGQIKFPATQNASSDANTLDDYEEGTWTPVLRDAPNGNIATTTQSLGFYTKVGSIVYVRARIVTIDTSGLTPGSQVVITGLPFSSRSGGNEDHLFEVVRVATNSAGNSSYGFLSSGSTVLYLGNNVATGRENFIVSHIVSNTTSLYISGTYSTN